MLASLDEDEQIEVKLFRSLIGHLMWLANQTRPDILNAVRSLARYCNAPTLRHWKAALHVLMFVRGTLDFGITFEGICVWCCMWTLTSPAGRRAASLCLGGF